MNTICHDVRNAVCNAVSNGVRRNVQNQNQNQSSSYVFLWLSNQVQEEPHLGDLAALGLGATR